MDGTASVRRELPVEVVGGAVFRLFNGSCFCPGLFSTALLDAFVRDSLSKGNVSARFLSFSFERGSSSDFASIPAPASVPSMEGCLAVFEELDFNLDGVPDFLLLGAVEGALKDQKLLIDVLASPVLLGFVVVAPLFPLSCLFLAARSIASQSISGSLLPPAGGPARVSVIDGNVSVWLVSVGTWEASPSIAGGSVISSVGEGGRAVPSVSGISSNLVLFMSSSISCNSSLPPSTAADDVQVEAGGGAELDSSDGGTALISVVLLWWRRLLLCSVVLPLPS